MAGPLLCSLVCIVLAPLTTGALTVGTFNTMLFRASSAFQERKDTIIQQLSTDDSLPDVMCLQEVFGASDQKELIESANKTYPHFASPYSLLSPPSPQRACDATAVSRYAACFIPNCFNNLTVNTGGKRLAQLNLLQCSQTVCREFYTPVSQSCISCVSYHFGVVQDPFTHCATQVPHSEYEFPNGLLLLSKHPLKDIKVVNYIENDTQIKEPLRRAYISAEVRIRRMRVQVVCTHLTSIVSGAPYTGPELYSTPQEQQLDEVYHLLDLVEQHDNIILLGDFNHGPAVHNTTWRAPFNYGLMNARGLVSVNSVWCAQCTICKDNPFTADQDNQVIDHIYVPVTWLSRVARVTMLLDTVRTPSGQPLSDHFGVQAKIRKRRSSPLRRVCTGSPFQGRKLPFSDMNDQEEQLSKICTSTG